VFKPSVPCKNHVGDLQSDPPHHAFNLNETLIDVFKATDDKNLH
jgi:hypothetical protein